MYANTVPLTLQIPNYISNNNSVNARKSPPINGFRMPFSYPHDNPNLFPSDKFLARAHLVEIKETPTQLLNNTEWDKLSQCMWNKFLKSQQTEETYRKKIMLWQQLYGIVGRHFLDVSWFFLRGNRQSKNFSVTETTSQKWALFSRINSLRLWCWCQWYWHVLSYKQNHAIRSQRGGIELSRLLGISY